MMTQSAHPRTGSGEIRSARAVAIIPNRSTANPKLVDIKDLTAKLVSRIRLSARSGVYSEAHIQISIAGEPTAVIAAANFVARDGLAITFPKSDADVPHPKLVMPPPESDIYAVFAAGGDFSNPIGFLTKVMPPFQIYYDEKLEVGYKWYDAHKKDVLFPFGFGLSYTTYAYSGLSVTRGENITVSWESVQRAFGEPSEIPGKSLLRGRNFVTSP